MNKNKSSMLLPLGSLIGFIVLGINLIRGSEENSNPTLSYYLGIITAVFFGGLFIYGIVKILKKENQS